MRLMFKRGDFFDGQGNILQKKDAQSPAGHIIEIYVLKTKTCAWDRKLAYYHLNYYKGVDIVWDTIDVATHFGYITNPAQGTFVLVNPDNGQVMTDEQGKQIKIRGRKNLVEYFKNNVVQWKKIYDLVYQKLSIKDDPHIKSFEEMLKIDIKDKLGLETITDNLEEL